MDSESLLKETFAGVCADHPVARQFFAQMNLTGPAEGQSAGAYIDSLDEFELADCGMDALALKETFTQYVARMEQLAARPLARITSIRVLGGTDKQGAPEHLDLTVHTGEVVCIVGPTGSGKSRLLEDIEYLAQGDTPTGRHVLVDGKVPTEQQRFAVEDKIIAQLSQSMVFVMDLSVRDFLQLHAESRMMDKDAIPAVVTQAYECAIGLAGEPFSPETSLTALSGGQSRALMIADLAFISTSPVVLIDEIENAGVDRKRALELLVGHDKIVFAVTHDPLIALMGTKRLVIGAGAVRTIIEPDDAEQRNLKELVAVDDELSRVRQLIREGKRIDAPLDFGDTTARY